MEVGRGRERRWEGILLFGPKLRVMRGGEAPSRKTGGKERSMFPREKGFKLSGDPCYTHTNPTPM